MIVDDRHIIRKQIIELELPAQKGALELQRKVGSLYKNEVKYQLEHVFDALNLAGQTLRIPRLEIDLGAISPDRLEKEFVEKCVQAIQLEVEKQAVQFAAGLDNGAAPRSTLHDISIFFYFLEHGCLPWYASYGGMDEMEEKIIKALSSNAKLIKTFFSKTIQDNNKAIVRLTQQFSDNFLTRMLDQIWQLEPAQWQSLLFEIEATAQTRLSIIEKQRLYKAAFILVAQKKVFDLSAFSKLQQKLEKALGRTTGGWIEKLVIELARQHFLVEANLSIEEFTERILHKIKERELSEAPIVGHPKETGWESNKQLIPTQTTEGQQAEEIEMAKEEGWYIENAGLVICAYFLQPFFKGLGLLEDGQFIDKTAQYRAVHLSHFLVTGEEQPAEFMLLLNKVICGVPTNEPVPKALELTAIEREEAENLLQYVINYWAILGKTSTASLRNTFLKRKGKLCYEHSRSSWLLQVEEKGYDICVEQLPWPISLIKLPWMNDPIIVDWM